MKKYLISDSSGKFSTTKRRVLDNGYLSLPDCCIARSGILQYSNVQVDGGRVVADGDLINVYRPPEAVRACYKSFANLPLTLKHPPGEAVTPENSNQFVRGALGSNPRIEISPNGKDVEVYCDIIVYDKDSQQAVINGDFEELSVGYETAFRQERGTSPDGKEYEAVQFFLSPNHVALVEKGRCGDGCRVCDHQDIKLKRSKEKNEMLRFKKVAKSNKSDSKESKISYLLVNDGEEKGTEISEEAYKMLKSDMPDIEEEEKKEGEDIILEPEKKTGDDEAKAFEGKETKEEEALEEAEKKGKEGDDDDDADVPGAEEAKKDDDDDAEREDVFVQFTFPDGKIGKMDKVALEHVQRLVEGNKRGDSAETIKAGKIAITVAEAGRIIDGFDVLTYRKGDSIDLDGIKKDVIKAVMPGVVVKMLKGDSLEVIYETAVKTAANNKTEWKRDMDAVEKVSKSSVSDSLEKVDLVKAAQSKFLKTQSGEK